MSVEFLSVLPKKAAVLGNSNRFELEVDIQLVFFFLACPGEAIFGPTKPIDYRYFRYRFMVAVS